VAICIASSALTSTAGTLIDAAFADVPVTGKTGFAATGVTTNDFWNTVDVNVQIVGNQGSILGLEFVDGTASGAGLSVAGTEAGGFYALNNGASDPMYGTYVFPYAAGNIILTITNLANGVYDFYFYGHGAADDENSIFQLASGSQNYGSEATTNGSGWLSPLWQEGVQYVEFTNVPVLAGHSVSVTVEPGASKYPVLSGLQMVAVSNGPLPFILTAPLSQDVVQGEEAVLGVLAGGPGEMAYQWQFNNAHIPGATNINYRLTNAQPANAGYYSLIVANSYGSVTSAVAALNVIVPVSKTIDVAFTGAPVTSKTGFAATGTASNDFWNTYDVHLPALTNLQFADGTASGAGLSEANISLVYDNGSPDPMYGVYVYSSSNIILTVTNLSAGSYDFYLYGHGDVDPENGVFQVTVGSRDYGTEATTNGPAWQSLVWEEGVQFVEFTNVTVVSGETVTITVDAEPIGGAVLGGLQMAYIALPPPKPFIADQPSNETVFETLTATFTVFAGGEEPLAYQWFFNNAAIPDATNSSYSVTNAQPADQGGYSVVVTNANGSATSIVATLSVNLLPINLIDVAFTFNTVSSKTGFAATGVSANDFWNTFETFSTREKSDLKFVDGTLSGVNLSEANVWSVETNGASDPMYGNYADASTNIILEVYDLPAGSYDFYLYGHGASDNEDGVFQLKVGSLNCGTQATTLGSGWLSSVWQEGVQYVEFRGVSVAAGQVVGITAELGANGNSGNSAIAVLSGLQMAYKSASPSGPVIINQPASQMTYQTVAAAFSVFADGAQPLSYQWLFKGFNISGANSSTYTVTNAQEANVGDYSVIITNQYGSVTSAAAALNISAPPSTVIDLDFTLADKTGFAAAGVSSNDYWNNFPLSSG
jgi:hypothetical protein